MTPSDDLARRVADAFDRDHAVLVGRATTGLKLLFDTVVDGEILFPSYICPIAVYPALYSGNKYRFCDVAVDDYNMTPETVSEALTPAIDAVLVTHMFGHPADMRGLAEVCDEQDVIVIEDACNAVGPERDGIRTGTFGTASIVSFGREKPIDAGCGGAVLTDDEMLAEEIASAAMSLPKLSMDEFDTLSEKYVEVYSAVQSLREVEPRAERMLNGFPSVFERWFLHGFPDWARGRLMSELRDVETLVSRRRDIASLYRREIKSKSVTHPKATGNPVHYRYGVLLDSEELRDRVLQRLRGQKLEVNSLHEPVHKLLGSGGSLPGAEAVSSRILNLRDAPRLSDEEHKRYARTVERTIEKCQ